MELAYRDKEDMKIYKHIVDLNDIQVQYDPDNNNKIKINDKCGIIMKYPGTNLPDDIKLAKNNMDLLNGIIKMCLDKVYDEEEIYSFSDYDEVDINDFIDSLDVNTFREINQFIKTLPKLNYIIKYKNSLGNERQIVLEKLSDFFTFV